LHKELRRRKKSSSPEKQEKKMSANSFQSRKIILRLLEPDPGTAGEKPGVYRPYQ
jgi:hypothetical protein